MCAMSSRVCHDSFTNVQQRPRSCTLPAALLCIFTTRTLSLCRMHSLYTAHTNLLRSRMCNDALALAPLLPLYHMYHVSLPHAPSLSAACTLFLHCTHYLTLPHALSTCITRAFSPDHTHTLSVSTNRNPDLYHTHSLSPSICTTATLSLHRSLPHPLSLSTTSLSSPHALPLSTTPTISLPPHALLLFTTRTLYLYHTHSLFVPHARARCFSNICAFSIWVGFVKCGVVCARDDGNESSSHTSMGLVTRLKCVVI